MFDNLDQSIARFRKRMGTESPAQSTRSRRSDRGRFRLPGPVSDRLQALLKTMERPTIRSLQSDLERYCQKVGFRPPSRATLYAFLAIAPTPAYLPTDLPSWVQDALYNLDLTVPVPGHQLAFYCFNYGDLRAVAFASGLPWLALYQAARMRGFRPKSRGLLDAILKVREI